MTFSLCHKVYVLQLLILAGTQFLAPRMCAYASHKNPALPTAAVINSFANNWVNNFDNAFDEWARRVIFAAIPASIAHVLDFVFVQAAEFMLVVIAEKTEFIDFVDDFTQCIATLQLVAYLAEDFANFVFQRIGTVCGYFELLEVGKQFEVHKLA